MSHRGLAPSIAHFDVLVSCMSCTALQQVQGRAKDSEVRKNKAALLLSANHVKRGETCISKNKPRDRSNLEPEKNLESLDVAALVNK